MSSRPNRFILNSDYMSLAQAGNQEIDIVLPAGTSISGLGYVTKLVNLPAVKGAIPRYLVSYETTVYNMETQQTETKTVTIPTEGMFDIWSSNGLPHYYVLFARPDKDKLMVSAQVITQSGDQPFDSITFKLRVSYMYPPNL